MANRLNGGVVRACFRFFESEAGLKMRVATGDVLIQEVRRLSMSRGLVERDNPCCERMTGRAAAALVVVGSVSAMGRIH
jgi:hypothetical protein